MPTDHEKYVHQLEENAQILKEHVASVALNRDLEKQLFDAREDLRMAHETIARLEQRLALATLSNLNVASNVGANPGSFADPASVEGVSILCDTQQSLLPPAAEPAPPQPSVSITSASVTSKRNLAIEDGQEEVEVPAPKRQNISPNHSLEPFPASTSSRNIRPVSPIAFKYNPRVLKFLTSGEENTDRYRSWKEVLKAAGVHPRKHHTEELAVRFLQSHGLPQVEVKPAIYSYVGIAERNHDAFVRFFMNEDAKADNIEDIEHAEGTEKGVAEQTAYGEASFSQPSHESTTLLSATTSSPTSRNISDSDPAVVAKRASQPNPANAITPKVVPAYAPTPIVFPDAPPPTLSDGGANTRNFRTWREILRAARPKISDSDLGRVREQVDTFVQEHGLTDADMAHFRRGPHMIVGFPEELHAVFVEFMEKVDEERLESKESGRRRKSAVASATLEASEEVQKEQDAKVDDLEVDEIEDDLEEDVEADEDASADSDYTSSSVSDQKIQQHSSTKSAAHDNESHLNSADRFGGIFSFYPAPTFQHEKKELGGFIFPEAPTPYLMDGTTRNMEGYRIWREIIAAAPGPAIDIQSRHIKYLHEYLSRHGLDDVMVRKNGTGRASLALSEVHHEPFVAYLREALKVASRRGSMMHKLRHVDDEEEAQVVAADADNSREDVLQEDSSEGADVHEPIVTPVRRLLSSSRVTPMQRQASPSYFHSTSSVHEENADEDGANDLNGFESEESLVFMDPPPEFLFDGITRNERGYRAWTEVMIAKDRNFSQKPWQKEWVEAYIVEKKLPLLHVSRRGYQIPAIPAILYENFLESMEAAVMSKPRRATLPSLAHQLVTPPPPAAPRTPMQVEKTKAESEPEDTDNDDDNSTDSAGVFVATAITRDEIATAICDFYDSHPAELVFKNLPPATLSDGTANLKGYRDWREVLRAADPDYETKRHHRAQVDGFFKFYQLPWVCVKGPRSRWESVAVDESNYITFIAYMHVVETKRTGEGVFVAQAVRRGSGALASELLVTEVDAPKTSDDGMELDFEMEGVEQVHMAQIAMDREKRVGPDFLSIIAAFMPSYSSLDDESRSIVKAGVKEFLEGELEERMEDCIEVVGDDETYYVPEDLVPEFKEWIYKELERCFPDSCSF
ncbi:hypothetical protein BC830DRAFT_1147381 [Chytriomyces sp. MP71]|nr:hypothetical protein BC830DRAFT_1147381 [Chytriomyces sp. MP71]